MYRDGKLEGASFGFKMKSLVEYVEFEMITRYSRWVGSWLFQVWSPESKAGLWTYIWNGINTEMVFRNGPGDASRGVEKGTNAWALGLSWKQAQRNRLHLEIFCIRISSVYSVDTV